MAKNESTPSTEPQQLNDDDLKEVSGGWHWKDSVTGSEGWGWRQSDEDALQADYAAHGAGMSLDDFMKAKGMDSREIGMRSLWLLC